MNPVATARSSRVGEQQKARYRLLVFGLLALFGPPAFGVQVGLLSALYSLTIAGYALWTMRLTVVFHDDDSLGYLLTLFDIVMTVPLLMWGTETWLTIPVVALWVAGLSMSASIQRHSRVHRTLVQTSVVDRTTGFLTAARFDAAVEVEISLAESRRAGFALFTIRLGRFDEVRVMQGPDAAERTVAVLARRGQRVVGAEAQGFRLSRDVVALLVPGCNPAAAAELAVEISRAETTLIDGRRADVLVGYAVAPRDGRTASELYDAATEAALSAPRIRAVPWTSSRSGAAAPAASRVAVS
jgi:GGDEF domain-containing protein